MDGGPIGEYLITSILLLGTILFIIEIRRKQ